jgi:hypothetical protein
VNDYVKEKIRPYFIVSCRGGSSIKYYCLLDLHSTALQSVIYIPKTTFTGSRTYRQAWTYIVIPTRRDVDELKTWRALSGVLRTVPYIVIGMPDNKYLFPNISSSTSWSLLYASNDVLLGPKSKNLWKWNFSH